jgi:PAS domain S-box-containing protein
VNARRHAPIEGVQVASVFLRHDEPHESMSIPNSSDILHAVIEATPDAIFVKGLDGRYILVNRAAARFIGLSKEQILGKHDLELYSAETARQFIEADHQVLAAREPQTFEGLATGYAGTQAYLVTKGIYCDNDGRILGLYGISHDMTELRLARKTLDDTREALFQSQKLEAIGQLTGGIAHDFNNILTVILGNLDLLRLQVPATPEVDEIINAVIRVALHGRDLTTHLLTFSQRRLLNPQAVDIDGLVTDIGRLLSRTLGATIQLTLDLHGGGGAALVDPSALEAAVLNLALNARDAMPHGGTLTLRTSRVEISDSPVTDEDPRCGSYAVLELEDTGCGMTADVIARAFEPFFTTKTGSQGTGLGLSMVYGFAKQSGGAVTIDSDPGRGTTVRMLLPLADVEVRQTQSENEEDGGPVASRIVLVVEDQPDVRHLVRRQLESLGHRVTVAEAASEALTLLEGPGAPDLLVTDIILAAGMNGFELASAARLHRPDLPVIFMSGYPAIPEARERVRETGAPLLAKPFTTPQLERAVNAVCTARSEP